LAFAKGVDPDVDKQYKEDRDVGDKDSDEEDPEGEAVKYTVLDD